MSKKSGTGGAGWGHPQGDMHMVAARLGCQSATQGDMHMVAARLGYHSTMVGTEWTNSCPGCMDRLRNRSFLAGRLLGL